MASDIFVKYSEVATYIVHQQFYSDPNKITDRRRMEEIKVNGSKKIIKKLIAQLLISVDFWDKGKEEEFLQILSKNLKLKYDTILPKYNDKINPILAHQDVEPSLKLMLAYSVVISEIQQKATKKVISEIKSNLKKEISSKKISKIIDDLSEQSDIDFSLLINLGILKAYAKIVKEPIPEDLYNDYMEKICCKIKQFNKLST
ncbi:MAG: hypothetical protein FK733_19035 [Asgard group archaeon]|nr:hypothetical protein [Asgard group archaeon]